MENGCKEPLHTWRMSSFLLRSLIMVLIAGVTELEVSVDVDVDVDADADADAVAELRGC